MESKLLKIGLNPGSKQKTLDLIEYMHSNTEYPRSEMAQKGYYWDSLFYDSDESGEYLYIVLKSEDFSKIMMDESELNTTPFRSVYEQFKRECWSSEHYRDIEFLHCFNTSMTFSQE
jgi:hypothetical protein